MNAQPDNLIEVRNMNFTRGKAERFLRKSIWMCLEEK